MVAKILWGFRGAQCFDYISLFYVRYCTWFVLSFFQAGGGEGVIGAGRVVTLVSWADWWVFFCLVWGALVNNEVSSRNGTDVYAGNKGRGKRAPWSHRRGAFVVEELGCPPPSPKPPSPPTPILNP